MDGLNVQSAVDTKHHLIVTHEVTKLDQTVASYPMLSRAQ